MLQLHKHIHSIILSAHILSFPFHSIPFLFQCNPSRFLFHHHHFASKIQKNKNTLQFNSYSIDSIIIFFHFCQIPFIFHSFPFNFYSSHFLSFYTFYFHLFSFVSFLSHSFIHSSHIVCVIFSIIF